MESVSYLFEMGIDYLIKIVDAITDSFAWCMAIFRKRT
jgi:hypothetical protein